MLLALTASAQLPQVQLPQIPLPAARGVLPEATRALGTPLSGLAAARSLRRDQLFEQHRAELDRDPAGELVIRAEVVAIDITDAALTRALKEDFLVSRTKELADLGVKITVLKTPDGWSAKRGLKRLRKLDPDGNYDYNHIYLDSGGAETNRTRRLDEPSTMGGATRIRVGVIDGGVDAAHVSLRQSVVHRFGCGGEFVSSPHGTAVASLIAGSAADFRGAAPRAEIFAADVYCGLATGGSVDAIAAAFSWMAKERVPVINVSLVGPRNALMERVVRALVERGHLIVAAVGNDGPASPPLYPAAYDGVIAVTAVDARHRVLLEACRGKHLALAAPGADIDAAAASDENGYAQVRGTSFAAPLVAGLLARALPQPDVVARDRAVTALMASAQDLGARGRDETYGAGLVAADLPQTAIK